MEGKENMNAFSESKFENFCTYLRYASDGTMDLDRLLTSEYGAELIRRLKVRFEIEDDLEKAAEYYRTLGLRREIFEWDDYYTAWTLLIPLDMKSGRLYPLLFWNHGGGNSIESEECMTGFAEIAAAEGFMIAMLQNTNAENVERILEIIKKKYPVDSGRVYIGGFSQGGNQAQSAYHHKPELFAACVTSGNDIFRPWDNFNRTYTEEELGRLKELCVPLIQFMGVCEPSKYAPLNDWAPRVMNPGLPKGQCDSAGRRGKDPLSDPTRIHFTKEDGTPGWKMGLNYNPEKGENIGKWCMNQTNRKLEILGCEPRDEETCLEYRNHPEDELHYHVGIYGDYEATELHYGYKHYTVGVNNRDGMEVYRIVSVENSPHWPQLAIGKLGWNFLKRFRRNSISGKIETVDEI